MYSACNKHIVNVGALYECFTKGSITPTGAHYHYLSSFKRYMNEINCYWDSLNLTPFFKMFSEMHGEGLVE